MQNAISPPTENNKTGFEHLQTDDLISLGQDATAAQTVSRLELGYLALEATKPARYGEGGLKEFANLIGADNQKQLYAYRRVAVCFDPDAAAQWLQYPVMRWSHLSAACVLPTPEERDAFLNRCLDENISTTRAHMEARAARDNDGEMPTVYYRGTDLHVAIEILQDLQRSGLEACDIRIAQTKTD